MSEHKYIIISCFPNQSKFTQEVLGGVGEETNTCFARSDSMYLNEKIGISFVERGDG